MDGLGYRWMDWDTDGWTGIQMDGLGHKSGTGVQTGAEPNWMWNPHGIPIRMIAIGMTAGAQVTAD